MRLELILGAMFPGSAAVGFTLNRFVLRRIAPGRKKAIAFAISRAVFYAPSIVHVGHGAYIPLPLLITLESSLHEFGAEFKRARISVARYRCSGLISCGVALCLSASGMMPNNAFESGRADKQRAFGLRPWPRAAQRERWAS